MDFQMLMAEFQRKWALKTLHILFILSLGEQVLDN